MARRGENIYKRKDGRWGGRIRVEQSDGIVKRRSVYAHSYLEIKQRLKDFQAGKIDRLPNKNTVEYYTEQWLKTVKVRCKRSTYGKYSNICKNHIVPILGQTHMNCLQNENVFSMLSQSERLAPKTQNDILCVLKMICSYAEADGCGNCTHLSDISIRVPKSAVQILSPDEQHRLVKYLLTNPGLVKLGIYLVLCTGMRIGELCALRRGNVDFQTRLVRVCATMQRIQTDDPAHKTEVIITEPKSACSIRDIPLTDEMAKFFEPFFVGMDEDSFVLTGKIDRFIEPNTMRYHFERILKLCGIARVKFHALRHTFATRCIESGMDVKTLSEILGHENVNITLNRYVHSSMELKRKSMEKLYCSSAYLPSILASSFDENGADKGAEEDLCQM
ncbi:MAG: site-specific integrase [Bacteroides sp.]|nr:site-specific integrase [Eubacterium sp.]MCM1418365.1 site-specific integrase [Roseburia sp.]MCM1462465.1 site-specific integrase [Bacteroides sp.]